MGSIAGGNTTLRSSRVGCQNEQQLTKRWSLWPRFLASSFLVKEEVAGRGRNPAFTEPLAVRELPPGNEVKDEEQGDLSTVLTTSAPVEMTGGEY